MRATPLPGDARDLAASGGLIFVSGSHLTAVGIDGGVRWQRELPGYPEPPRATAAGTVWITSESRLVEIGPGGETVRTVTLDHEPHEFLAAMVLLPGGFCVFWLPAAPAHLIEDGRFPRIARYTHTGATVWSTPLAIPAVPMRKPRTLMADSRQPLLVSADRVVATVLDYGSGIGGCTFLDTVTGLVTGATPPAPYQHKAIAGPGMFLIGTQGYDEFSTTLYDRDADTMQTWPSHGMMLVAHDGTISGPELENVLPSRCRFRTLSPSGALADGPALPGYYTGHPSRDAAGTTVFWREGRLQTVDKDLNLTVLYTHDDPKAHAGRTLLLDDGLVVVAVNDQLLFFPDTGLGPLDPGPWPCAEAGLLNNPVAYL